MRSQRSRLEIYTRVFTRTTDSWIWVWCNDAGQNAAQSCILRVRWRMKFFPLKIEINRVLASHISWMHASLNVYWQMKIENSNLISSHFANDEIQNIYLVWNCEHFDFTGNQQHEHEASLSHFMNKSNAENETVLCLREWFFSFCQNEPVTKKVIFDINLSQCLLWKIAPVVQIHNVRI